MFKKDSVFSGRIKKQKPHCIFSAECNLFKESGWKQQAVSQIGNGSISFRIHLSNIELALMKFIQYCYRKERLNLNWFFV